MHPLPADFVCCPKNQTAGLPPYQYRPDKFLQYFLLGTSLLLLFFPDIKFVVGVYYDEGPPVPIPNTVVKLIRAENTWLEAARENRSMPT